MNDRYRSLVDVCVLLRRTDGHILLLERANTGYGDGLLCPPSGHLEAGESVITAAIREVSEEVGVLVDAADLHFVHVVHYRSDHGHGRVGFFFSTRRWQGIPVNREPHKCAGLYWVDPFQPPAKTLAYTAGVLTQLAVGNPFSVNR